jgi:hypothetical protein
MHLRVSDVLAAPPDRSRSHHQPTISDPELLSWIAGKTRGGIVAVSRSHAYWSISLGWGHRSSNGRLAGANSSFAGARHFFILCSRLVIRLSISLVASACAKPWTTLASSAASGGDNSPPATACTIVAIAPTASAAIAS